MPQAFASALNTQGSEKRVLATLRSRLEARRPELEQIVLTRVTAIADADSVADPAYADGLKVAVDSALEYGLMAIERDGSELPIPIALLGQARVAARNGISLDTVLRRYVAGYSALGYFLIEEAGREGLMSGARLQRLIAAQASLFDRLLAAIGEEHARESRASRLSARQLQAARIERLLDGEFLDTAHIAYDFSGWHLGAIAQGEEATAALRRLAHELDLRLLLVERRDGHTVWCWFGRRSRPDPLALLRRVGAWTEGSPLAFGEPGEGLIGWRTTHRQAAAALAVARRRPQNPTRYADVALLAAALQNDLLGESLRQIYLSPLEAERDDGAAVRDTVRAYFGAGGSLSSAAAATGVSRRTVARRLNRYEELLGHSLHAAAAQIETALLLQTLDPD